MLGTQDMPAIKQVLQINDRLEAYIKFIGRKLEEQPYTPPYMYRGKNYNVSTIVGVAVTRWATDIAAGIPLDEERLKAYLVEYLYVAYLDKGRYTQVYIQEHLAEQLDGIGDYLLDYPGGVPLLAEKGAKKINRRLIIVVALVRLAEELGHSIPKLLPPKP